MSLIALSSLNPIALLITAPPLLLSLCLHELAHARTALAFGDPTAKYMGRVTMNPLAHLDLLGTVCLLFSGFIGWAKPVPVNVANLNPRRLGNFSVSIAGVTTNLLLAAVSGLILRMTLPFIPDYYLGQLSIPSALMAMLASMMMANLGMFIFNLIPLHPLDGSHVLQELLPFNMQQNYVFWQRRFGMYFLAALIFLPRLTGYAFDPVGVIYRYVLLGCLSVLDFPPHALVALGKVVELIRF